MAGLLRRVRFQPDYYMSTQFAGVAVALAKGAYAKRGIEMELLPTLPPGDEVRAVAESTTLTIGCTEQNIIIPAIRDDSQDVVAVAAMLG